MLLVIEVLRAPGGILTRGLQHSTRSPIDRDLGPGRRNFESLNSCKIDPTHLPAVGCDIAKMVLRSNSPNPSLPQSFSSVHSDRRDFKVDDSSDRETSTVGVLPLTSSRRRGHIEINPGHQFKCREFRLLHCPISGRLRPGPNENGTAVMIALFTRLMASRFNAALRPIQR